MTEQAEATHRRGGAPTRRRSATLDQQHKPKKVFNPLGVVLTLPAAVPFVLFLVWPIFRALRLSFYELSGFGGQEFVGFANYVRAFTDSDLGLAVVRNMGLAVATTLASVTCGFVIAYFLFRRALGWKFLQVSLFIPFILPVAVTGLLWIFIFEPNQGLLNTTLTALGLEGLTRIWLGNTATALPAATLVWVWRTVPLVMLLLFAAMLRIDSEVLDAASIDGAGEWTKMTRIVLPIVAPTVWLIAVLVLVDTFRGFDLMLILTGGGPLGSTRIAALYVYEQGFVFNNFGYANALGFVLAVVLIGVVALAMRQIRRSGV